MKTLTAILFAVLITGCASSRVSTTGVRKVDHPIKTIAMSPSGGLLADAIAIEFSNAGYDVFDPQQSSELFIRLNLSEVEVSKSTGLAILKENGIDAYLSVKSAAAYDGLPQSASVRLNSTQTAQIITGLAWQNGWGGQAGSISDRMMRKDIAMAAREISAALMRNINPEKAKALYPIKKRKYDHHTQTWRYERN